MANNYLPKRQGSEPSPLLLIGIGGRPDPSRNWMVFDCGSGFALATEAATSINCDSVESVLERPREMRPGATTPNALRHKENHEASFDRHHKKMPPAR